MPDTTTEVQTSSAASLYSRFQVDSESPGAHDRSADVLLTFEIVKLVGLGQVLLAQLTRHRIASFSVQSQRYVSYENGFGYIGDFGKNCAKIKET